MLSRIEHERIPTSYFQLLANALARAEVCGTAVVAELGPTDNPDMIGEVADLLIRKEATEQVLCYGLHDEKMLFSIRTSETAGDAGKIARRVAGRKGTAGGHNTFAGGQIQLTKGRADDYTAIGGEITARFKRAVDVQHVPAEKLIKERTLKS